MPKALYNICVIEVSYDVAHKIEESFNDDKDIYKRNRSYLSCKVQ